MASTELIADNPAANAEHIHSAAQLYVELWVSLASLLRSYTAAHGLNGKRQATVELGEETIIVRHGEGWLELTRTASQVSWKREDSSNGHVQFTEDGNLRSQDASEEEMDMAAERWARELMTREGQE